ncbi:tripartite motif containing 13-like [Diadema antillarum]|uniref:tripartite motif containing 13-like n=1 Tax=Diadema antillarum TaxID=105358 RepID=UPI003A8C05B4
MASFEEHLTCPVCRDRIVDARQLPCGHSFCKTCINEMVSRKRQSNQEELECPYCRDSTRISKLEKTLKPNYALNNILDAINSAPENVCVEHPRSERNYYCEQCEVLVCSECVVRDHYAHGKAPKAVDEVVGIITADMDALILQGEEHVIQLNKYNSSLRNIRSKGDKELQRLEDEVMAEYSILQKQLDEQKERLLSSIATMKSDIQQGVDSALSANEELTSRVSESLRTAREKLSTFNPVDLVSSFKTWVTQLKTDLVKEIPNTREEEGALKMLKLLHFQKSTLSQSRTLEIGSIGHREPSDLDGEAGDGIQEDIDQAQNEHGDDVERINEVPEAPESLDDDEDTDSNSLEYRFSDDDI